MKGGNRNNVASSSNQRARISRRTGPQQQLQQQQQQLPPQTKQQKAAEEKKPLISPKGRNPVPGGIVKFLSPQSAPRSGQFILPTVTTLTAHSSDDKGKPRVGYRVNLPWRMLAILSLVFLAMPLTIFMYKEVKIKEDHEIAHEKPHHLQPVANAHDLLAQMANQTISIPAIGSEPIPVPSQATSNTTAAGDKELPAGASESTEVDKTGNEALESEKVVISEPTTKTNQTAPSTNQTRLRRF